MRFCVQILVIDTKEIIRYKILTSTIPFEHSSNIFLIQFFLTLALNSKSYVAMKTKNVNEKEHVDQLESGSKDFIDPDKNVISLFDTDILVQVVNA